MKYILTQEEYDQLSGKAENIRAEYQKQVTEVIYQFNKDVRKLIAEHTGSDPSVVSSSIFRNHGVDLLIKAWQVAADKMVIKPLEDKKSV